MAMEEMEQMEGEGAPEGGKDPVSDAANQAMQGMGALAELLTQEGAPPGAADALAGVMQHFDEVMQQIMSGEGAPPKAQGKGGVSPVHQMSKPVGPAGV